MDVAPVATSRAIVSSCMLNRSRASPEREPGEGSPVARSSVAAR
nr:hypothetical protein [Actinoplanes derwentensis]